MNLRNDPSAGSSTESFLRDCWIGTRIPLVNLRHDPSAGSSTESLLRDCRIVTRNPLVNLRNDPCAGSSTESLLRDCRIVTRIPLVNLRNDHWRKSPLCGEFVNLPLEDLRTFMCSVLLCAFTHLTSPFVYSAYFHGNELKYDVNLTDRNLPWFDKC